MNIRFLFLFLFFPSVYSQKIELNINLFFDNKELLFDKDTIIDGNNYNLILKNKAGLKSKKKIFLKNLVLVLNDEYLKVETLILQNVQVKVDKFTSFRINKLIIIGNNCFFVDKRIDLMGMDFEHSKGYYERLKEFLFGHSNVSTNELFIKFNYSTSNIFGNLNILFLLLSDKPFLEYLYKKNPRCVKELRIKIKKNHSIKVLN